MRSLVSIEQQSPRRPCDRAPMVTEQGNPAIYVQIDELLPLYKGNIYVVGYTCQHLMRTAETASHHPFEDHEL